LSAAEGGDKMNIENIAQATSWGFLLFMALGTIYFWFVKSPIDEMGGLVCAIFFGVGAYLKYLWLRK